MLHATRDVTRNTVLQHCCDIVLNGYNIVPAFQHHVAKDRRCESSRVTSPLVIQNGIVIEQNNGKETTKMSAARVNLFFC